MKKIFCAAAAYNWCTVEESSYDVILFPAIAVVLACLFQGRYSTTLVLLAGTLSAEWCPQCLLFLLEGELLWTIKAYHLSLSWLCGCGGY